ncbi:MAG TPA: DUF4129 domain-containing protein [Candidatus Acidoferrum sp.]|nr:DUF4129 domain-containing protein [Candidatus Acidoferrum sp.]
MKRTQRRQQGRGSLHLMEEATHVLRTAPAGTLAIYYLGGIPFVLGLLFFWADMSRSPFARQHLAAASFGMAGLFFWMKFCQAIFARRIRNQVAGENGPAPDWRRGVRIFVTQAILQPTSLFVLPLALLPCLPFPYAYAFYQNATALDDGAGTGTAALVKRSGQLAKLWPGQNFVVLAISLAFAFVIFLNWTTACLVLPQLGKMLFGIESNFTQSPLAMLNTTFFAAMFGLTYLCADPLLKTIYALRCFYGESLQSGADLKAELKPFIQSVIKVAIAILLFSLIHFTTPASAQPSGTPAVTEVKPGVAPPDLDRVINRTIHEDKYLWRMPRETLAEPDKDQGVIASFIEKVGEMIRSCLRTLLDWIEEWWRKLFPHSREVPTSGSGYGWILSLHLLLYGLAIGLIVALLIFLFRLWQQRHRAPAVTATIPIQPVPDLTDENVRADQLPEDGWTRLARELLERGEFRLAMRAFYLASLAQLAQRNLISIARFKSNRDYEQELSRRAHSLPGLPAIFGDNISLFERTWYGTHEASGELVRQFADRVEQLKAGG